MATPRLVESGCACPPGSLPQTEGRRVVVQRRVALDEGDEVLRLEGVETQLSREPDHRIVLLAADHDGVGHLAAELVDESEAAVLVAVQDSDVPARQKLRQDAPLPVVLALEGDTDPTEEGRSRHLHDAVDVPPELRQQEVAQQVVDRTATSDEGVRLLPVTVEQGALESDLVTRVDPVERDGNAQEGEEEERDVRDQGGAPEEIVQHTGRDYPDP